MVGIRLLRVPGVPIVSIKALFSVFSSKNWFKKYHLPPFFAWAGKTRFICKTHQILGIYQNFSNNLWENFYWLRQANETNKKVNNKIIFFLLYSQRHKFNKFYNTERILGTNKALRDCYDRTALLLLGGDVESNPGPDRYKKNV